MGLLIDFDAFGKVMRLANLNVFVPCLVLAEVVFGTPIALLVSVLATPFGGFLKFNVTYIFPLSYLVILLSLVFIAMKYDLSPILRKPEREGRYRAGHWLIGITSLAAFLAFTIPILMAKSNGDGGFMLGAWLAMLVVGFGVFPWAGGLYMVRSARA